MAQKKLILIRCQQCHKNPATVLHQCPKNESNKEHLCNCCKLCKENCNEIIKEEI